MTSGLVSDLPEAYSSATLATFQELVGARIRELRNEKGMTSQGQLAARITDRRRRGDPNAASVSTDTISRAERGGNNTTDMLEEIAEALDCTLAGLVVGALVPEEPADDQAHKDLQFEQLIRERLGDERYRILVRRLIGAQRAFATLAEIAPELLHGEERSEDLWTELVPKDMQPFFAAMLERFDIDNVEPAIARQLKLIKR